MLTELFPFYDTEEQTDSHPIFSSKTPSFPPTSGRAPDKPFFSHLAISFPNAAGTALSALNP